MMAQSHQRTSRRQDPIGELARVRRDASGGIYRAPSQAPSRLDASGRIYRSASSITSAESMRLACAPKSFAERKQPVKYQSSVPALSVSSSEDSSAMPHNSRLSSGGSFWTKGKSLLSKCKSLSPKGSVKSDKTSKGDLVTTKDNIESLKPSKDNTESLKHVELSASVGQNHTSAEIQVRESLKHVESSGSVGQNHTSAEIQVRQDDNEKIEEYVDERYVEEYDESVYHEDTATVDTNDERRAVIKDSWDFFRMVCSLSRDRRKYDEVFRRMQLDPVYPYLDSMMGMNDSIDDVPRENAGANKHLSQAVRDEYCMMPAAGMNKHLSQVTKDTYYKMSVSAITQDLVKQAEVALPSLVEICKALATSLGIEEYAVGPLKEAKSAIRKAEEKYEGDVLKVTDFCRALIVVEDFPTLLALLELACDSFSPLIRRVKLSSLQSYRASKPGGYRDCIINIELKDHICEISVHLQPLWTVCGVDGFRHYRHCLKYSIDTFGDPKNALVGLDSMTVSDLIRVAENSVSGMPLETLEWHHEKFILDYFCEGLLFLHRGLNELAESTFNKLVKLRCLHPDIGPDHPETVVLYGYLKQALQVQSKNAEAEIVAGWILESDQKGRMGKAEAEKPIWDQLVLEPLESIIDPGKKEREVEERLKKEVRASKQAWKKIREERFKFLDGV
jgi:hypothetical protein